MKVKWCWIRGWGSETLLVNSTAESTMSCWSQLHSTVCALWREYFTKICYLFPQHYVCERFTAVNPGLTDQTVADACISACECLLESCAFVSLSLWMTPSRRLLCMCLLSHAHTNVSRNGCHHCVKYHSIAYGEQVFWCQVWSFSWVEFVLNNIHFHKIKNCIYKKDTKYSTSTMGSEL